MADSNASSVPEQERRDPLPGSAHDDESRQPTIAFGDSQATRDFPELSPPPGVPQRPQELPRIAGYEILEVLGRGGMGVVYKARQVGLNRLVAIKMILGGSHAAPEELARFRTEAQAVARLTHPNIVQIHEIGEHDGMPYFALEYCDGGSLSKKLAGTPLAPPEAARMLHALAAAMHFAHQKNVIHRDLKPANVLLQIADFGLQIGKSEICDLKSAIPKVTDFGLAKKLDDAGQTASGAVIGTPSYMPPEQAAGKIQEVAPAADIYALGAILYELLTGRPPFKAATSVDTIVQVIHDEPVPPARLNPRVPRDLETICLKCLQKEPRRRYTSMAALAEDLRRFLAGEPIVARPISRLARLARWCRRKPLVASLTAALLLVLIVGFAAVLSLWLLAESRGTQALAEKSKAARQRDHARQAYDEVVNIAEEWLAAEPGGQPEQRDFLEKALKYHEELLEEPDVDEKTRHRAAQLYLFLGRLYPNLDQPERSLPAYRQALRLWQDLAGEFPAKPRYARELFGIHKMFAGVGTLSDEERSYHRGQATRWIEHLVSLEPANPTYGDLHANFFYSLGNDEMQKPGFGEAEKHYEQGLRLAQEFADANQSRFHRINVTRTLKGLALLYQQKGDYNQALAKLRQALDVQQELASAPVKGLSTYDNLGVQLDLSGLHVHLSDVYADLEKWPEAEKHAWQAWQLSKKVADPQNALRNFRAHDAQMQSHLACVLRDAGRISDAEKIGAGYEAALRRLMADFPGAADDTRLTLAWWLTFAPVESARDPKTALELARAGVEREPGRFEWHLILGAAACQASDPKTSIPALQKVLDKNAPAALRPYANLFLAMAHKKNGDPKQARECFEQARREIGEHPSRELRRLRAEAAR